MKNSFLYALLFLFLAVPISTVADEELEELNDQIAETERRHDLTVRLAETLSERIRLLKSVRSHRKTVLSLEEKIEQADDDGNDRLIEQLEEQLGEAEGETEQAYSTLEFLEHTTDLIRLLSELDDPRGHRELRTDIESLLNRLKTGRKLLNDLHEIYREGPEQKEGQYEDKLEQFHEDFEHRREVLHLKIELYWAIEEDDEDAINELEEELRILGAEQNHVPDKPQAAARDHPAPLELTNAEVIATADISFERKIVPIIRTACFGCHSNTESSGDLNLEALVQVQPLVKNRGQWINVIEQLKVRSMPPADAAQPSNEHRRILAAWLTNAIENFDYSTVQSPGYETARRLTHEEYNNTVRDLVGIDIRPADRFPDDMAAGTGFDNSANTLFIQPIDLERYLGAAELIADVAFPDEVGAPAQATAWQTLMSTKTEFQLESIIQRFLVRAFRRPVSTDELATFVDYYKQLQPDGKFQRRAMRQVVQAILVSPKFLIRSEEYAPELRDAVDRPNAHSSTASRISDWELASRLSYYLWASMPDDRLFEAARKKELRRPDVLAAQVERMLNDEKSGTLGTIFAAQWLRFSELDRVQRDQIDNPWATDSLVEAMALETSSLFNSLVQNDEPIERLIDADYTFLNEELARHYRIDDVEGKEFRRVSLRSSPRRGLLTHAGILTLTSFPGRTSPVVRGNWILTELLGTPPPPPPPNVSEFSERVEESRRLTQRQKLELHRSNPNCYACHSRIDPLGFALEEYDWFGRHRLESHGKPIDATGQFSDGETFSGVRGLANVIVNQRIDDLAEQLTRKMLSYALGRHLDYYDEATVRNVVSQFQHKDRRLRALIHAIVQSDAFQWKQQISNH